MELMTIRRGPLYFGVFLVAAGGVTLLAAAGLLDRARVVDVLAYWPLAVIAIGVGLVLRRTGAAVPGGMLAAAPDLPTPCTDGRLATATPVTREGAFGATARVDLELSCGELGVS